MTLTLRIESTLKTALEHGARENAPPLLVAALQHAVFPGGARVRPLLCLAVAGACGDDAPELSNAAAGAIELLHCASLVHDDLPCFDNAATRRGKPSVHAVYGEPLAVLTGDALIVAAFEALARGAAAAPLRLAPLLSTLARGVGMPYGIVAGQAWESEPFTPVEPYHRAKTGALFVAATACGAIAAGADPAVWRALGENLGAAYQVADDLFDAVAAEEDGGKPIRRDAALQRPSVVAELGVAGAYKRLEGLVRGAMAAIPPCEGASMLRELVRLQATRLAPKQLALTAA